MNKNAIQKYAIWARSELNEQVKQRAYQYAITDKGYGDENATVIAGRVLSPDEKRQRQSFVELIKMNGFKQAVEEVAYTWFNRFVALRYMEVNDFLPSHVRVFSDASGDFNPEILKDALHIDLEGLDKAKVSELLNANKTEELYRYLLLTQCNALNALLPEMFERMGAYTEMLLPNNILKPEGVIGRIVKDIPEEDFRDAVQIIGWLYQYYNTELFNVLFDGELARKPLTHLTLPNATQLFTPDWSVRTMVENTLGRLWLESHPNCGLKANWKYYLDEAEQIPEVAERLRFLRSDKAVKSPEEIRFIDPCMGSGHILVYAFDVLMQIYVSEGYSERDAATLILEKNIHGLDIDKRAYQLAYFALMMKARQYNRRILNSEVKPQVYCPVGYSDGEEYGSILRVEELEPCPEESKDRQIDMFDENFATKLNTWNFRRILSQKYDVVVTNPPYLSSPRMSAKLAGYVQENYNEAKADLATVMYLSCFRNLLKSGGLISFITTNSWMFLKSFEKLRKICLAESSLEFIVDYGTELFDGKIGHLPIIAWGSRKSSIEKKFPSIRLVDYCYSKRHMKENEYFNPDNLYIAEQSAFGLVSGSPFAYWISPTVLETFRLKENIGNIAEIVSGMTTGDNEKYLRLWSEVGIESIAFNRNSLSSIDLDATKWIPYHKGGEQRKWYGNNYFIVNWSCSKDFNRAKTTMTHVYLKPCITWSDISGTNFAGRFCDGGFMFDVKGSCAFGNIKDLHYLIGLFNSKLTPIYVEALNPTTTTQVGDLKRIPLIKAESTAIVEQLTDNNITLSRSDWNAFETSWDFTRHPLVNGERSVAAAFTKWECEAAERFDTLKANEEELNRIFIDIYGLQDELTPEVEDKDVTVRRADLGREIRSLISYAVGCMLGRYSLDCEGLAYAGGDWDAGKYQTFPADMDNILPICDDEYFDDDIAGRFVEFIKTVYGVDTLEENLRFIADALAGKGTPREVIRSYFLNDFYKDHLKIYQKRPIYWMFDSGKKNGFKALIYMHRYSSDLLAKLRTDYVHEQQERYRTQLSHIVGALNTATGAERARLLKQQDKLTEQLRELTAFEEKVHHLADQNIMIDLDNGVKKNYEYFADVMAKI